MKSLSKNQSTLNILGSLTVETAIVLPVFIYAIIAFIYFIQIIGIHEDIQYAITETGLDAGKYAYVYDYIQYYNRDNLGKQEYSYEDEGNIDTKIETSLEVIVAKSINSSYFKMKMKDYLNEDRLNHSCIQGGYEGLNTYLSSFMENDNCVDIIVVYQIKLPLIFFKLDSIQMIQRVRTRGWSGHRVEHKNSSPDDTDSNQIVYITEHGTVYHLTKECTHLTLSIQEINYNQIDHYRNESGGKYKECNLCNNDQTNNHGTVYITKTGDRYHYSLSCSGLKRNIISISINNIGEKSLCSRCGKNKE